MLSEEQEEKINRRVLETVNLFLKMNGKVSDAKLALLLKEKGIETSSSTVGRDLTSEKLLLYIGQERFDDIRRIRQENKKEGNKLGGVNFSENNIAIKDEKGKFTGSSKK